MLISFSLSVSVLLSGKVNLEASDEKERKKRRNQGREERSKGGREETERAKEKKTALTLLILADSCVKSLKGF